MILRIWAQDPPYDMQGEFWNVQIKKAIVPELGVGFMPKPLQKPHPPIHISIGSPDSRVGEARRRQRGWGIISGPVAPALCRSPPLEGLQRSAARSRHAARAAKTGGCRADVIVAPTDAEAEERVYGERASNRYYFSYMRKAIAAAKRLWMIKPRPDMTDEECTPDAIMNECVIHGSPRTVLDKLVALRERVGPFGTLLQIGLDWSGPNEAWEREGMRLLAHEVMPTLPPARHRAGGGVDRLLAAQPPQRHVKRALAAMRDRGGFEADHIARGTPAGRATSAPCA